MIGVGRRGCASLVSARPTSAGDEAGEGGDPAAEDEPRHGRADHHLALMAEQLAAPVGGLRHLAAQALDGDAEVGPIGLYGAADLLRGASGHRAASSRSTAVVGVAGCGAVSVALISCASSIA